MAIGAADPGLVHEPHAAPSIAGIGNLARKTARFELCHASQHGDVALHVYRKCQRARPGTRLGRRRPWRAGPLSSVISGLNPVVTAPVPRRHRPDWWSDAGDHA